MLNPGARNCEIMQKFPKLKISGLGWESGGELRDLEDARYFAFTEDLIVTLEGQVVNSYDDIQRIAASEGMQDKDYLELTFLPFIAGG